MSNNTKKITENMQDVSLEVVEQKITSYRNKIIDAKKTTPNEEQAKTLAAMVSRLAQWEAEKARREKLMLSNKKRRSAQPVVSIDLPSEEDEDGDDSEYDEANDSGADLTGFVVDDDDDGSSGEDSDAALSKELKKLQMKKLLRQQAKELERLQQKKKKNKTKTKKPEAMEVSDDAASDASEAEEEEAPKKNKKISKKAKKLIKPVIADSVSDSEYEDAMSVTAEDVPSVAIGDLSVAEEDEAEEIPKKKVVRIPEEAEKRAERKAKKEEKEKTNGKAVKRHRSDETNGEDAAAGEKKRKTLTGVKRSVSQPVPEPVTPTKTEPTERKKPKAATKKAAAAAKKDDEDAEDDEDKEEPEEKDVEPAGKHAVMYSQTWHRVRPRSGKKAGQVLVPTAENVGHIDTSSVEVITEMREYLKTMLSGTQPGPRSLSGVIRKADDLPSVVTKLITSAMGRDLFTKDDPDNRESRFIVSRSNDRAPFDLSVLFAKDVVDAMLITFGNAPNHGWCLNYNYPQNRQTQFLKPRQLASAGVWSLLPFIRHYASFNLPPRETLNYSSAAQRADPVLEVSMPSLVGGEIVQASWTFMVVYVRQLAKKGGKGAKGGKGSKAATKSSGAAEEKKQSKKKTTEEKKEKKEKKEKPTKTALKKTSTPKKSSAEELLSTPAVAKVISFAAEDEDEYEDVTAAAAAAPDASEMTDDDAAAEEPTKPGPLGAGMMLPQGFGAPPGGMTTRDTTDDWAEVKSSSPMEIAAAVATSLQSSGASSSSSSCSSSSSSSSSMVIEEPQASATSEAATPTAKDAFAAMIREVMPECNRTETLKLLLDNNGTLDAIRLVATNESKAIISCNAVLRTMGLMENRCAKLYEADGRSVAVLASSKPGNTALAYFNKPLAAHVLTIQECKQLGINKMSADPISKQLFWVAYVMEHAETKARADQVIKNAPTYKLTGLMYTPKKQPTA